jgi:CubicO group peptidase (beta-lactamase class C family)
MPYSDDDVPAPLGHYGYPDYPDGQLRTSVSQLARFLLMLTARGSCGGHRILADATVEAMEVPQIPSLEPTQALSLFRSHAGDLDVLGHDGGDAGVTTEMFFDPNLAAGYVFLANQSVTVTAIPSQVDAMADVSAKLMALAQALP